MIAPWTPYAMRGLVWYQGERNVADGAAYVPKMHALYNGWAHEFENQALGLRFVQVAPWGDERVPALQMAQARFAAEEPRAAMVTICDAGNPADIHPGDKETVGQRLAFLALARDYGFPFDAEAPAPREWRVEGDAFLVEFGHAKSLCVYNPDKSLVAGLELCGEDGEFESRRDRRARRRTQARRLGRRRVRSEEAALPPFAPVVRRDPQRSQFARGPVPAHGGAWLRRQRNGGFSSLTCPGSTGSSSSSPSAS